jgi:hypothetical protein
VPGGAKGDRQMEGRPGREPPYPAGVDQESHSPSGWDWFRRLMAERRPGRLATREWLVQSAVLVSAVAVTAAVVFPLVGLGSWLHAGLLAAAIGVTGVCFTRVATKT